MFKGGLKKLPFDIRDSRYNHEKVFGVSAEPMPDRYLLPSTILDQDGTYHCTAYASCAIQESQEKIQFDPEWFYKQIGFIAGKYSDYGYSLRDALLTGVKKGFKPLVGMEIDAEKYKEGGFYWITGTDLFLKVKQAMWRAKNELKTALGGTGWYDNWTLSQNGIVKEGIDFVGLHAVSIKGWDKIDGKEYLVIQNSYGTQYGNKGFFYFPKEVFNKTFTQGLGVWRSVSEEQQITKLNILLETLYKLINLIVNSIDNIGSAIYKTLFKND